MIVNAEELEKKDFYENFVKPKIPVLIKNFLDSDKLDRLVTKNRENLHNIDGRGSAKFLYLQFSSPEIKDHLHQIPLIKGMMQNEEIEFRENFRLWEHNSGKVSPFHYDKGSIDILNICLAGSKEWNFVSPDTPLKCFPFTNICIPFTSLSKCKAVDLVMEKGDLIYVPRNWFHRVKTVADQTRTINMIFLDSGDIRINSRERELAAIKKRLKPNFSYSFNNCSRIEKAVQSTPLGNIVKRCAIELLPISLVLIALIATVLLSTAI